MRPPWYQKPPKPTRSGTTWGEADYAKAGYGTVKLRLPRRTLDRLTQLAETRGVSRAALVEQLVDKGVHCLDTP
jgi:hypothetical protein